MPRFAWFTAVVLLFAVVHAGAPAQAAKCDFTAGNISFGTYDLLTSQSTLTSGTISVVCNPAAPTPVVISLSAGQSGSFAARAMNAGVTDRLYYNIFLDSSFTVVFGDGNGGSQRLSMNVDKNTPWIVPFYARAPAGQDVTPGLYSDLLTLTVDF